MAARDFWILTNRTACCLAAGLLCLLVSGCPGPTTADSKSPGGSKSSSDPLEAMKKAYAQAKSYADAGELHIESTKRGQSREVQPIPFAVSFERPNKLRIDSFDANIACDGKQFYAVVADQAMSDQILYHPAPAELTLEQVYSDPAAPRKCSSARHGRAVAAA